MGESLYDAIDDLFRSGRASRDIDINRDNLIDATDDVVSTPEYTAGCSAGATAMTTFGSGICS